MGNQNHPYRLVLSEYATPKPSERWREDAECYNTFDPDMWFQKSDTEKGAFALSICRQCPVKMECLASALQEERQPKSSRHGIRGGLTPGARKRLDKKMEKDND